MRLSIKTHAVLLVGVMAAMIPTLLATPGSALPRSTSPTCPIQCPQGFAVKVYTWEVKPERTIYDDLGKAQVAEDSPWPVSCELRCEQHAANQPTKEWKESKVLCKSGAEPKPYRGPWRNFGPFGKQCAATAKDGCGMQCYAPRVVKATGKKGRGKAGGAK